MSLESQAVCSLFARAGDTQHHIQACSPLFFRTISKFAKGFLFSAPSAALDRFHEKRFVYTDYKQR